MKAVSKFPLVVLLLAFLSNAWSQEFQGKAYYYSKSTLELGAWGARMSKQQKDQIKARLKNRLEKTYVLSFNKTESIYKEEEVLDAISGATDSWGKNFTAGNQYKNVKLNRLIQNQEFYGKKFLINDSLQKIEWRITTEQKKIGNYVCYKAIGVIPSSELNWWAFSWSKLREKEQQLEDHSEVDNDDEAYSLTQIVAWYTPQIPVSHGPSEYWGLPGLILEVNVDGTTILCSKLIINPNEQVEIKAPDKGKLVSKDEYCEIMFKKMKEFRENRMGRRRTSG